MYIPGSPVIMFSGPFWLPTVQFSHERKHIPTDSLLFIDIASSVVVGQFLGSTLITNGYEISNLLQ